MPADTQPGAEFHPVRAGADVLFSDGEWRIVEVRGWQRDRLGRWCMDLEWHWGGDTWGERYVYDAALVRPDQEQGITFAQPASERSQVVQPAPILRSGHLNVLRAARDRVHAVPVPGSWRR
jgi:hypothetical protein